MNFQLGSIMHPPLPYCTGISPQPDPLPPAACGGAWQLTHDNNTPPAPAKSHRATLFVLISDRDLNDTFAALYQTVLVR
jgi:hypothetical protein